MEDPQKTLTKWVQLLIESEMPKGINQKTIQQYLSYFMRILSARLGSSSQRPAQDEKLIGTQLRRQGKTSSQQLRVQELLQKLDRYPSALTNRISILQLLLKLSDSAEAKNSLDKIDAIFKNSKETLWHNGQNGRESIAKQAKQPNNIMEIENDTTMHSLGNNNNTNQSQFSGMNQTNRSILSQSSGQFQQTIKRVHNKGNPQIDLAENDLIRDLIFTFQAIDGHYINYHKNEDKFMLKSNVPVSDPVRQLVNKLCLMGDIYRKIQLSLNVEAQGQVRQSLHQAIRDELNEYYRLIAIFENELSNSNANSSNNSSDNSSPQLTLRKLQLWVGEPQERLKWLAVICDATQGMSGFQIISAVNAYESQGSPPIQQLIRRILQNIVQPFLKYVNSWVYNGESNDPQSEFFVTENIAENDVWNKRYQLVVRQIPNIIDKKNAITIFNIGRSVNFLHRACKSTDWKLNLSPCDLKIVDKKSFDTFKSWIEEASILTNNTIVHILVDKYQLKLHLFAIKKFILMGQGDFISQLMDLLVEQLSKNANEIHRHNLLGSLEGAIRSSNQGGESSQRLDIKLLEASPGDKGWDIFTLDYNVDAPLDTILSTQVMRKYLKIFNFLWRVRRMNHCLSQVWLDHMKQSSLMSKNSSSSSVPVNRLMKRFNVLRHEMTHFVNNLNCYMMVDGIETTWKQFLDDFEKRRDFSEIIETHSEFVESILEKLLLTEKNLTIYRQIISLFNFIIKFRNTQLVILTELQEEIERIREVKNTNAQRRLLMKFNDNDDSYSDGDMDTEDFRMPPTSKQFIQLANDFHKAFADLLVLLKKEDKLRFLSFKLDFNEYYSSKQIEYMGNFSQDQLNKYSTSGALSFNSSFQLKDNNTNIRDQRDASPFTQIPKLSSSQLKIPVNSTFTSNLPFFKQDKIQKDTRVNEGSFLSNKNLTEPTMSKSNQTINDSLSLTPLNSNFFQKPPITNYKPDYSRFNRNTMEEEILEPKNNLIISKLANNLMNMDSKSTFTRNPQMFNQQPKPIVPLNNFFQANQYKNLKATGQQREERHMQNEIDLTQNKKYRGLSDQQFDEGQQNHELYEYPQDEYNNQNNSYEDQEQDDDRDEDQESLQDDQNNSFQ